MTNRETLGCHWHRFPYQGDPKPAFIPRYVRSHDMGGPNGAGVSWRDIEKSPGVYDPSVLDPLMALAEELDFLVIYTLNTIPDFYAKDQRTGMYGGKGEGSAPKDDCFDKAGKMLAWARNRYGYRFAIAEGGNEPDFTGQGFWWGTCEEMIRQNAAIFDAVTPLGMTVLSPGLNTIWTLKKYFNTVDPVSGRNGASTCHAVAIHDYCVEPTPADSINNLTYGDMGYQTIRDALVGTGAANYDLYSTEYGIDWKLPSDVLVEFAAKSPAQRADFMYRLLTESKRVGFKVRCIYGYNDGLSGDLMNDTDGVLAGIDQFINFDDSNTSTILPGDDDMTKTEFQTAATAIQTMLNALVARVSSEGVTADPVTTKTPVVAPVIETWTTVGQEGGIFKLDTPSKVRYGDPATNRFSPVKIMSGAIQCNNSTFGDPALGIAKVAQVSNIKPT